MFNAGGGRATTQIHVDVSKRALGALCIILGAIGDSNGFWVERPFLTNLVSSLAGASFGIPVAILVLQQVSMRQAKVAELRDWASEAFRELQTLKAIVVLRKGIDRCHVS